MAEVIFGAILIIAFKGVKSLLLTSSVSDSPNTRIRSLFLFLRAVSLGYYVKKQDLTPKPRALTLTGV